MGSDLLNTFSKHLKISPFASMLKTLLLYAPHSLYNPENGVNLIIFLSSNSS
jgi:hypothetical protein